MGYTADRAAMIEGIVDQALLRLSDSEVSDLAADFDSEARRTGDRTWQAAAAFLRGDGSPGLESGSVLRARVMEGISDQALLRLSDSEVSDLAADFDSEARLTGDRTWQAAADFLRDQSVASSVQDGDLAAAMWLTGAADPHSIADVVTAAAEADTREVQGRPTGPEQGLGGDRDNLDR